jgi:hypothetical protein
MAVASALELLLTLRRPSSREPGRRADRMLAGAGWRIELMNGVK